MPTISPTVSPKKKSTKEREEAKAVDEVLDELKKKQKEDKKLVTKARGVKASFHTAQSLINPYSCMIRSSIKLARRFKI